jgi:DNA-binding response OmpR family regulator
MARVLIVDSDQQSRSELATEVRCLGHDVRVASSYVAALEVLGGEAVDVMLAHCEVRQRGADLLESAREVAPNTRIVLMGEDATANDYKVGLDRGAVDVLNIPCNPGDLERTLVRALDCNTGYHGTLHGLELLDILQMLHLARRSVVLRVGTDRAEIHLQKGEIVHAVYGTASGPEALLAILASRSGSVETRAAEPCPETIDQPFEGLILDTLRQIDEASVSGAPSQASARSSSLSDSSSIRLLSDPSIRILSEERAQAGVDPSASKISVGSDPSVASNARAQAPNASRVPNASAVNAAKAVSNAGQAGSNAAQAGSNAAQAGSNAAQAGSNAAQAGSNAAQAGSNAAQAGSNAAQAGSNAAQAGSNAGQARGARKSPTGPEAPLTLAPSDFAGLPLGGHTGPSIPQDHGAQSHRTETDAPTPKLMPAVPMSVAPTQPTAPVLAAAKPATPMQPAALPPAPMPPVPRASESQQLEPIAVRGELRQSQAHGRGRGHWVGPLLWGLGVGALVMTTGIVIWSMQDSAETTRRVSAASLPPHPAPAVVPLKSKSQVPAENNGVVAKTDRALDSDTSSATAEKNKKKKTQKQAKDDQTSQPRKSAKAKKASSDSKRQRRASRDSKRARKRDKAARDAKRRGRRDRGRLTARADVSRSDASKARKSEAVKKDVPQTPSKAAVTKKPAQPEKAAKTVDRPHRPAIGILD